MIPLGFNGCVDEMIIITPLENGKTMVTQPCVLTVRTSSFRWKNQQLAIGSHFEAASPVFASSALTPHLTRGCEHYIF